jgi:AAA domain
MGRSRTETVETLPPLLFPRGRQETAVLHEQEVPEYRGNPLIEALPLIWTRAEVTEKLSHFPPYCEEQRQWPDHLRLHLIENAREFFIPQGIHLEIEIRVSCMLRRGYRQRNPLARGYWPEINDRIETLKLRQTEKVFLPAKARGFAVVGPSGVGKSTALENILSLYPQVILHSQYGDQPLILKQLVWLKLDCPKDGSIKGLCLNFFQAVDDILGTNYYERYTNSLRTVDELLPRMARVAALHCLGVLVIDEIQNLRESRSGGAAQMLNFFVQLENTIGVPFALIGTPKAMPLLRGEFRQARRASEQGDVVWPRMCEKNPRHPEQADPVWEEFVRALCAYDYLRTPTTLPDDMLRSPVCRVLYDESQGIAAVAVTVWLLAQRRAITSGREQVTAGVIRSVAKDSQRLIREMLEELRAGGERSPHTISDLADPTVDDFGVNSGGGAVVSSHQQTCQKTDAPPALDNDDLRNAGAALAKQIRPALRPMDEN